MQKFIISAGVATRISDCGKGERVVLLLHGFLESLDIWENFAVELAKTGVRVVSLDIPGHGISQTIGETHTMSRMAEVAVGVLNAVGVQQAIVVGHSMGGYVALEMLHNSAERVAGIVLFSSTPNSDTAEKRADRDRMIKIIESGRKELLLGNSAEGFAEENRRRCAADIKELDEQLYISEDAGIIALLRGMSEREDLNEVLRQSSVPQMFIFGEQDSFIPKDVADTVAKHHPQAQAIYLPHSGHNGFLEEAEMSVEVIGNFVSRLTT